MRASSAKLSPLRTITLNYRLKVSQGELAGSFLSRLDVFRGGVPFQVTNWSGVLAHLESYEFRPTFVADEEGAWRSMSVEAAERFQAILRYLGIESEIVPVEPPVRQQGPAPSRAT